MKLGIDNKRNLGGFVPLAVVLGILVLIIAGGSYYSWRIANKGDTKPINSAETPIATSGVVSPSPNVTNVNPTTKPLDYTVPSNWTKTSTLNNSLTLCLPPKWEADKWGNVYFNRDASYRPTVAFIQEIPYSTGPRREAYYKFWESEYPNVRELVTIKESDINSNSVLTVYSANSNESKTSPDGNLAVVWYAKGKLWKAGLSGWSAVNSSQTAFLKDFFTSVSCSF